MNREAERKRLVELISECCAKNLNMVQLLEFEKLILADHLLDNGIVVPPVKVGQTVYVMNKTWRQAYLWVNYDNTFIKTTHYIVADVVAIIKTRKQTLVKLGTYNHATFTREYERYPISAIGKTVFTSREDAVKALEGKEDEGK